jgi:hypothetical protein
MRGTAKTPPPRIGEPRDLQPDGVAVTVTAAERLAETLHRLGYLIDRHHLPEPVELRVRRLSVAVDLADLHDLNRWAEATDAAVSDVSTVSRSDLYVACTVLGDVPLRLTCFGEALTP